MRLWRKNRSPNADKCKAPGRCCMGVDLNRNFNEHWGDPGASTDPCANDYMGSSAFSEPESKAVGDFLMSHDREVQAFITFHSYGQIWMHPYGFAYKSYPKDVSELKNVATEAVKALRSDRGTRYQVGSAADTMYITSGASDDWAKLKAGIKYVYLVELTPAGMWHGNGGFILSPNQIIPTGRETWEGVKVVANAVLKKNGFNVVQKQKQRVKGGRHRNH